MQINSSKVNSALSSKNVVNKMMSSTVQGKLGIKDTAGAQSFIKNQRNTTVLGRALTAAGMKEGAREALTKAVATGGSGTDFKSGVGAHTKETMIAKAVASDSYRKSQEKIYGESFKKVVDERIAHMEHIKEVSIHAKMHDDAVVMLQQRIDEQNKVEFGNSGVGRGGGASNKTAAGNYKQPPPSNNQFFAA